MSALRGYQSALDLYLQENGITTLLIGGVNADQVVFSSILVLRTNIPTVGSALEAHSSMHTFGDTIAY